MNKKGYHSGRMAYFCLLFIVLSFLLDSGGPIGIRNLAFALAVILAILTFFSQKQPRFHRLWLPIYLSMASAFIIGVMVTANSSLDLTAVIPWVLPMLSIPIFALAFSQIKSDIIDKALCTASFIFSLIIFISYLSMVVYGDIAAVAFKSLNIPGFFYMREDGFPQIYFQSTLSLVPLTIYAYCCGRKKIAIISFTALMLTYSRFGTLTVILFYLVNKFISEKAFSKVSLKICLLIMVAFIPICVFTYFNLPRDIDYATDSSLVRFGHLYSIFNEIDMQHILFGSGPGSMFWSVGFNELTDNIEVSQLEVFRKYGLVGYFLINVALYLIQKLMVLRGNYKGQLVFFFFYIVSFSNPVLLSFFSSLLISLLLNNKKGITKDVVNDDLIQGKS